MDTSILEITIKGRTPLLCNRFGDEQQQGATTGHRSSITTAKDNVRDEAAGRLYVTEEGTPFIPGTNILRCIIDAGKYHKIGRAKVTTQKSSLIPAAVAINTIVVPIQSEGGWKVDTRPVRIPATGGRILRHRPCFDDWSLTFVVELDTTIISEPIFRAIVDDAGHQDRPRRLPA